MLKLKSSNLISKAVLSFLLIWGAASFFLFPSFPLIKWFVLGLSTLAFLLIFFKSGDFFLFILASFSNLYAFYGLLFTYNLSLWLVLIGVVIIFSTIFLILSPKIIPDRDRLPLFLAFFFILVSEVFLALSFWLVNPLTRSLIVALFVYIFFGFLSSLKGEIFAGRNFRLYVYFATVVLLLLVLTVSWGS